MTQARINYKILHYGRRPWWRRRWETHIEIVGFPGVPTEVVKASYWTSGLAQRAIKRVANGLDFKITESATMRHE